MSTILATYLPIEQVSRLTIISVMPAKDAARITPTMYTFKEVSSMLNVPSMQVLGISGSLVAVLGPFSKGLVTVGAVITGHRT